MPNGESDDRSRLYGDIDRLVKITIEGEVYEVPDQLELLRCFQYLDFHIAYEDFCWNASCENCATEVSGERTLCCQMPAEEGIVVKKLPAGVKKP